MEPETEKKVNWKKYLPWIIIGVILIAALIFVAVLNIKKDEELSGKTTDQIAGDLDIDNGDQKIDWSLYPTTDVKLTESYTINRSGTYNLTGEISDGLITVSTNDSVVRLVLKGVDISNSNGPAIYVEDAKDVVIELAENSVNTLKDGVSYSNPDEDVNGTIFSKDDLTFQGSGKLVIEANYLDAIVSKDDLKFISGKYDITAVDDGIRGKDSVYILDGNFNLSTGGDGIKSTNDTEETKGFVRIESGNFKIKSNGKGIKAINNISIDTGEFSINSDDDAIHSNDYVGLKEGAFDIFSNDDGIHADAELVIDGGEIKIEKSYEALEAARVTINGGDISLTARDDGINVAGGNDNSSQNRPGANSFEVDENNVLTINGGKLYINSAGDGMDSNGYIYVNGGDVIVDGPTSGADGALDANGGIIINGGSLIAIGASGMAEAPSTDSKINSISAYISTNSAGTVISVTDAKGNEIMSHTAAKSFSHIVVASSKFTIGSTYTLNVGTNYSEDLTLQNIVTSVGGGGGQPNGGPGGGDFQGRGRR